ncbi:RHS repeat-associated core domain-containing protein [Shewanella denitrificans]|uniref:RHS repeat-associated core domain-containing protein n=1 Tax=Shewanella denitrificans TaxID=192073 RepID=UPI0022B38A83|nr:RHS repeat-associated core domain-containing protein [Shewanella denitrificans]
MSDNQSSKTTDVYYVHTDHLGTPTALSDTAGTVQWQVHYTPFGQTIVDIDKIKQAIRFPRQYYDEESGLHYNYFRDYDPELGRYIQSDPIGLAGGINTYGYVGGNPISYVDPYGLNRGRTRAQQGNFFQPIINGQVQGLINQIRQFDSNFSYRTARPSRGPNSAYGRNDVAYLQNLLRNSRESSQCSINGNYNPTGQSGSPLNIVSEYGPFSISGTPFSTHALSRMQGRGIPPSAVLNAIQNGTSRPGNRPNTTVHNYGNVTVITNSTTGNVISVIPY